ncbi:MAG: histidine phosphatase family protein [Alphaproteobacteria bacterium]
MTPGVPFYFVRHGVTDHNRARLVMGQRDVPLNAEGRRQARRAAAILVGHPVGAIHASPLGRALETARIIGEVLGREVRTDPRLMERRWGIYEGRDRALRPIDSDPEGGETLADFTARTLAGVAEAGADADAAPILVVAHNGTCRVLRRHFGLPGAEDLVPNAVPLRFEPSADGWREIVLGADAGTLINSHSNGHHGPP